MKIYTIEPKEFAANTYFVTVDGVHAVAIDAAQPRVAEEAKKLGLQVEHVLLTHAHYDHIAGCAALAEGGAKVSCLDKERNAVAGYNVAAQFAEDEDFPEVPLDRLFSDGEILHLCGLEIRVIATPGHTAGSCCFLVKDGEETVLFSGDTLFRGNIGKTQGVEATRQIESSLEKLSKLENYTVYPGHGAPTTIEEEKKNGFLPA